MIKERNSQLSSMSDNQDHKWGDHLQYSLDNLERISLRLRMYGNLVFLLTLIDILLVVFITLGIRYFYGLTLRTGPFLTIFATVNFVATLCTVVLYEYLRRKGDAYFEEISDELQWNVGYRRRTSNPDKNADETPPLQIRVILRSFARTTDLPLIPGKFGPAIYAGINVVLALFLLSSLVTRF